MTVDNRRADRRSSLYAVVVEADGRRIPAKLRNHSSTGCRLTLDEPMRTDDITVTVMRGDHATKGIIAWRNGSSIGIHFPDEPPEEMFSPSVKIDAGERRTPQQRHRRPGLGIENISGTDAEHGRRWAQGHPDYKR